MKPYQRRLYIAAALMLVLGMLAGLTTLGTYLYLAPTLPDVETLKDIRLQVPLRIYSRDGRLLAQFGEQRRIPVSFEDIPDAVVQAFLAAEDDRFFEHPGVDYQGLVRATLVSMIAGSARQGGSTITMQLARNFYLTREKKIRRKLQEIFLALRIERELTKQEILTLYLNKIFLGHRAYGVAAAAEVYYGKNLDDLDLHEIATIAGLPKAPSTMNPVTNKDLARQRRNYVLRRMFELGFIDSESYQVAVDSPVESQLHGPTVEVKAPYLGEMVRDELVRSIGTEVYTAGYKVTTTIDSRMQRAAVKALRQGLLDYDRRHGYRGAIARVDLETPESESEAEAELDSESEWAEALDQYPEVGGLQPGLITEVLEQDATVFLKTGRLITLGWEGMSWAKRFINDNAHGAAPETAADILTAGDVVYLQQLGPETWQLAEVPEVQGAIVSLDPRDGAIVALSGGFDFYASKYNRAVQALRQPGSAFKPFVYSSALERGFTPATIIQDAPVVFEDPALEDFWRPENYSGQFYGPTRLREGLVKSRNLVSVRLLRSVGIGFATRYIRRFGFPPEALPRDLSLALGSANVSVLQLASAYATFANGGYGIEPHFVQRIEAAGGAVVFEANPLFVCADCLAEDEDEEAQDTAGPSAELTARSEVAARERPDTIDVFDPGGTGYMQDAPLALRVITPQNAYLMTDMMRDVIRRGTGRRALALGRRDLAGKTGTTNDRRDAWFSGFNGQLVATAWVGFDQERPLGNREEGGRTALPMWVYFMANALTDMPETLLEEPPGLVTARINPETGYRAQAGDPNAIWETFYAGNIPELDPNLPSLDLDIVPGIDEEPPEEPLF